MKKSPQRNQLLINIKNYIKKHRVQFYVLICVFIGIIVGFSVYFITNSKKNEKFNYLKKDHFNNHNNKSQPSNSPKLFRIYGLNGKYIDLTNSVLHGNSDGQQKGCWTLDSTPEWKAALKDNYRCAAISISLPNNVKATTYTSLGRWDGLCNQMKIEDIPAGVQNYTLKRHPTNNTPVCGFLFSEADSSSGSSNDQYSSDRTAYEKEIRDKRLTQIGNLIDCGERPDEYDDIDSKRKESPFSNFVCVYKYSESQIQNLMNEWDIKAKSNSSKSTSSKSNYSNTKNPNAENKLGCPYTLGLTTSDSNEEAVKRTCDLDPKCVGYYKGSTGWCVASQTHPKDCKNFSGDAGYNVFKSKSSKYSNTKNPNAENKLGCPYTLGLTTSDSNEEAVKRTCDLDPKCVGYYKGSTGWCVASQTHPKDCKNFSGDAGYKDFMMKIIKK